MIPVLCITTTARLDLFEKMISSINYPIDRVSILVNNHSIDYLLKVRSFCKNELVNEFMVSHCPYNMGYSSSTNYHMKMNSDAPYWIFGSDDMEFQEDDLHNFEMLLKEYDFVADIDSICLGTIYGMTRECVNKVGFFDENIHPANFEDNEFIARVRHHNIIEKRIPLKSKHVGGGTSVAFLQKNDGKDYQFLRWSPDGPWSLNERYYQNKILNRQDFSEAKFDFEERSKKLLRVDYWM